MAGSSLSCTGQWVSSDARCSVGSTSAICRRTASSSNGAASRLSILIAPSGQCPRHAPRPSQRLSESSLALPWTIRIAPSSQAGTHSPQPLQRSSSIEATVRIIFRSLRSLRSSFPFRGAPLCQQMIGEAGPRCLDMDQRESTFSNFSESDQGSDFQVPPWRIGYPALAESWRRKRLSSPFSDQQGPRHLLLSTQICYRFAADTEGSLRTRARDPREPAGAAGYAGRGEGE